jgi:WD40 repeat protein/serine/threonine protein kinase
LNAVRTSNDLAQALRTLRLLEAAQLAELPALKARWPEPRALARELIGRGWLTPYQVNQLFLGRGAELLLGSYLLLERLGEGGMGLVFKARNWKVGTHVAVKIIRKERLNSADAVRRFQREIRLASRLSHPNIVAALDADTAGGNHFLVMEYVAGTTLSKLVEKRGRLPVAEACDLVRQAALGLQHAHEKGLVHRDIKPANLLVSAPTPAAPFGVVKLLDLGLARVLESQEADDKSSTVTQEGTLMGTPDFMAPEQSKGSVPIDIRADLYSLGCTLYFLLAAQVPFPRGTLGQKIVRHLYAEATPLEQLRPDVPPGIAAVVRRLMAKRPADRYPTPAALADVLAAGGETNLPPTSAPAPAGPNWAEVVAPSQSPSTLRRRARRRRLLLGMLIVLGLTGLVLALVLSRRPPRDGPGEGDGAAAELRRLEARLGRRGEDPGQLRDSVLAFRRKHAGTAPALQAAGLLARLPSPLDSLREEDVPPAEKAAALARLRVTTPEGGQGPAPRLVAVLGDSRFQHWASNVRAVAWSPDGQVVASGGDDWGIDLREPATGKLVRALTGHQGVIYALGWSPDSSRLASASADGSVRLWRRSDGREALTLKGHAGPVFAVGWSPDGRHLASGGNDALVRLWDPATGDELRQLKGSAGVLRALAFAPRRAGAPEGSAPAWLASAGDDRIVRVWDLASGDLVARLEGHTGAVQGLAFLPDRRLVSGDVNGDIKVWDVAGQKEQPGWGGPKGNIRQLTLSPDGQTLGACTPSGIFLWSIARGKGIGQVSPKAAEHSASFSPDGKTLVTGSLDVRVKLWDLERNSEEVGTAYQPGPIGAVAVPEDARWLVTAQDQGRVGLYEGATGRLVRLMELGSYRPYSLILSPDGKVVVGRGAEVLWWDPGTGRETAHWEWGHAATSLGFLNQGRLLAVCDPGFPGVDLLDAATGVRRSALAEGTKVAALAVSADGRRVVTAAWKETEATVWDAVAGKALRTLAGHQRPVRAVAWRGDGQLLATGGEDTTIKLWDPDTGKEKETLSGHRGTILSVTFRPDGRLLASAAQDGSVRLWDVETGACRRILQLGPPGGRVNQVLFSPDGRHLLTANGNGTVYVLRLAEPAGER